MDQVRHDIPQGPVFDGKVSSLRVFKVRMSYFLMKNCPGAERVLEGKEVTKEQEQFAYLCITSALEGCKGTTAATGALGEEDAASAWRTLLDYYQRPENEVQKTSHLVDFFNDTKMMPGDSEDEYAKRLYDARDKFYSVYDKEETVTWGKVATAIAFANFHMTKPKAFGNEIKTPPASVQEMTKQILSSNPKLGEIRGEEAEQVLYIGKSPQRPKRAKTMCKCGPRGLGGTSNRDYNPPMAQ
ncbi:hypothetical protein PTSG_07812 [Salpingoeca rosetta]|uniref:Uncharacterized protein n=1 Tax=Salpingoeca rosetta (strain ATCC 50818 / BSB-021) TaxID=946362 RepID=F2UGE4_SALR5|nr:uncharacterized protein PTSG_07812 [Salpingoeca rosetta]EGD75694.1 hypothetical protein PTSG_07812 [Salpingoeca rosetta]|eukprot:XP_004991615.1 hypothetical protein PTSG_07812 [Salpingoeca rosetta]